LTLLAKQRTFFTTTTSKAAALLAMIVAISGVITSIFYLNIEIASKPRRPIALAAIPTISSVRIILLKAYKN
jgi:hypothetical protein